MSDEEGTAMAEDRPNSLVRRMFESAFNQGRLTVVDEIVAGDGVTRTANGGMLDGRLEIKHLIATFRTAFPDLHCVVMEEVREGDMQAAHWTMRGTHRGPYLGNRPTNRSVEVQGFFLARIADGRIVENWILFEEFRVLQQIGVVPPL